MPSLNAGDLKVEITPDVIDEALAKVAASVVHFDEAMAILNEWLDTHADLTIMQGARDQRWYLWRNDGRIEYDSDGERLSYPTFSIALKAALERVDNGR